MLWNLTFRVSINMYLFKDKVWWMVEFTWLGSHSLLIHEIFQHENVDMPQRRICTCRLVLLKASSWLLVGENGQQRRFLCLLLHFWRLLCPPNVHCPERWLRRWWCRWWWKHENEALWLLSCSLKSMTRYLSYCGITAHLVCGVE